MSTVASSSRASMSSAPAVILIALTPAIMVLLPWDFGSDMNPYRSFMRGTSFPVTVVELLVAGIAMRGGFKLVPSIISLPMLTKLGLFLFWLIFLFSSLAVAARPLFALIGFTQICVHLLFALSLVHLISVRPDYFHRHIWSMTGLGILGYTLLWGLNILFYDPQGDDWVWFVPTLTNIRWIGFFAFACFCAGLGALATTSDGRIDRAKIKLPLMLLAIGFFLAIWTATRGAILAIIIAATIASYVSRDWRVVAGLILVAAIIASAVAAALPAVHPIYGLERLFGSATQSDGMNEFSSGRVQLWMQTMQKIEAHPWIGWGIDQFRFSGPEATLGFRHPHQSILQLFFAAGFLGAAALALVVTPLLQRLPIPLSSPTHWAAGSYVIAGTIYGLHDGFFYYAYPVMIYLVSIAMLIKLPPLPSAADKSG